LYPTSQLPGYRAGDITGGNIRLLQPSVFNSAGNIIHLTLFSATFTPGEIVHAIVEVGTLSLDSGLVSIFPKSIFLVFVY
jgi:hypothetical protein